MKGQRLMKIAAAAVLLLAIVMIVYIITMDYRDAREDMNITLPEGGSVSDAASDVLQSAEADIYSHLEEISIDKKNIKSVISTLDRAAGYTLTAQIDRFYNGSEKNTLITHSVMEDKTKTEVDNGSEKEHILRSDGNIYRWMDDDSTYYKASAGSFTGDDAAELPTYETVLELDEKYITAASYTELNGRMYVYVEYFMEDAGYIERYYISITNGLLMKAETYEGGELIYSMNVLNVNEEQPSEAVFALPSIE